VLWQKQPEPDEEPVLPDEFASARFKPETASKIKLIASAREMLDIPLVVVSPSFDYFGVGF
jgi:hypothetical protein